MSDIRTDLRQLKNFILHPRAQLQPVLILSIITIFFGICSIILHYHYLYTLELNVNTVHTLSTDMESIYREDQRRVIWLLIALIVAQLCSTFVLLVVQSHRLVGPTVAFQRHLKALINGQYQERVQIRKTDYFKDTAALLNSLAQSLEGKHLLEKATTVKPASPSSQPAQTQEPASSP